MAATSDQSMAGTIGIVRYIGRHLLRSCRNQRPFFDPSFPFALSSEPIFGNPIFTEPAPPKLRQNLWYMAPVAVKNEHTPSLNRMFIHLGIVNDWFYR